MELFGHGRLEMGRGDRRLVKRMLAGESPIKTVICAPGWSYRGGFSTSRRKGAHS